MENEVLDFVKKNIDRVVTDVTKRTKLRFKVPVHEIKNIEFIEPSEMISYTFIYPESEAITGSIDDFLSIFGEDNFTKVEYEVEVNVTVKKDKIKIEDVDNFYIFLDYKSFFNSLSDIDILDSTSKLIVVILSEECNFESEFIKIFNYSSFEKNNLYDNKIKSDELKLLNELNSIFKDKELDNFLVYPLSWLSVNKKYDSYKLFNYTVIETFFSIISNKVVSKDNFIIRGYKTIDLKISKQFNYSPKSVESIEQLMRFIIDKQRGYDKLILLRNTLTLYLDSEENSEGLNDKIYEIKKNVEYNFNVYIQDKIKVFLEQKNKILQEFILATKKIDELTNSLITQFRTVILSLLGTIFLTLLGNVSKANSKPMINLVLLSYLVYFIVNLFIIIDQKKQKESLLCGLKTYTEEVGNIGSIKKDDDMSYEKLKEKYLNKTITNYYDTRLFMIVSLGFLIATFTLLYLSNRFEFFNAIKEIVKWLVGY